MVFGVGFLLGPIRVLWLEPAVGQAVATVMEAPFLLAAIAWSARRIHRQFDLTSHTRQHATIGLAALALVIIADLAFGTTVRGFTWSDQIAAWQTSAGQIYLILLAIFAVAPLIAGAATRGR
jgi:hypothetical protein